MNALNADSSLTTLLAIDDSLHAAATVSLLTHIKWPAGTSVHVLAVEPEHLPLVNLSRVTPEILVTQVAAKLRAHELVVKAELGQWTPQHGWSRREL